MPWRCLAGALLLCGMIGAIPAAAGVGPVEVRDDSGRRVHLAQPARRVIALAPHLAEVVYALGGGRQLVGTVRHADFPNAAQALPRVGDALHVNLERLLALQPDLVLGWQSGNPEAVLARLSELGIAVHRSESPTLASVAATLEQIGVLLGRSDLAAPVAASYRRHLAALRQRGSGAPVRVFYQVWPRPLMTVNREHLIGQALALCGGENIFADAAVPVPQVGLEAVLAGRPELILAGSPSGHDGGLARFWAPYPAIPAVRDGRLVTVPADWVSRPGPRLALGVEALCDALDAVRLEQNR